ncbi:MAG: radical SAM/SPASM domain-containing protein [Planctomycetota bacterium]|nr:MAG: radical SAM/SPASM domain-containing protein [Planctomycetota bacterium]
MVLPQGLRSWVRRTVILQRTIEHLRTVRLRRTHPLGIIPDAPSRIIVEPTNACNLKCGFCGNKDMLRPWTYLPMDLYEQLIGEMVELDIPRITLHTIGESTMNPNLPDMVRIAKAAGLVATLSTNGTLLSEELVRKLVHAGPDILNVSVDAADPAAFKAIRPGIDPAGVLAGMKRLKRIRDAEGPLRDSPWGEVRLPTLVGTCVITPYFDRAEEMRFFETYGPLVDDFFFHWPNNHANYAHDEPHRLRSLIPRKAQDWLYKKVRQSCSYPWDALFLLSDGTMSVCRFDFDARVKVGRFGPQSIRELWHSEAMQSLRRAHMTFDFRDWSTCEDCSATWYENRHEHYTTSQKIKRRNGYVAARNAWLTLDPMKQRAALGSGTVESEVGKKLAVTGRG